MKTLREYIDQLDEISRRDFIKGAGATAGLAAMGAPTKAQAIEPLKLEIDDLRRVSTAMSVFEFAKEDGASDISKLIATEINRLNKVMPEYMERVMAMHKWTLANRKEPINRKRPITMEPWVKDLIFDLQQISKKYEEKYNQTVREEAVDETATPNAVKRIEQLVQYK
jgi:hypothetical protein